MAAQAGTSTGHDTSVEHERKHASESGAHRELNELLVSCGGAWRSSGHGGGARGRAVAEGGKEKEFGALGTVRRHSRALSGFTGR